MLEDACHSVLTAKDGQEALTLVMEQHDRLDAILMDCLMPVLDGFEATEKIRAFEIKHQLKSLPIIALTANAYKEVEERCLSVSMDGFLTKPVDEMIMLSEIEAKIKSARSE